MKIEDFIDVLESDKIIPGKIVQKLRSKIDQTDKDVSAKSVARYLVDKGYLSKYQVQQIFEAAAAARDEIELQVSPEQIDDTNELLKDLNPAAAAVSPAHDATRVFTEQDAAQPYDASIEVVNVEHEMTMQQGMGGDPGQAVYDPLAEGGFDDQFGAEDAEVTELESFHGKKKKTNQWESRWLFVGSAVLALLIMVGVILAFTIFKADATKMWEDATGAFKSGRYSEAIDKLQQYIDAFPNDDKVADARVMIANSELRIPYEAKQWDTALKRSQKVLPELKAWLDEEEKLDKLGDLRSDLGVMLPGTAIGFTQQGLDNDDVEVKKTQLQLALDTKVLIDNPAYVPGSERRKPAVAESLKLLTNNIAKIRRQIEMEKQYVQALAEMSEMTDEGDTRGAFETFHDLTIRYPELKIRDELQDAMQAISRREADLVETVDLELPATSAPPSPIQSSLILATRSGQERIAGLSGEMLVHLVNGSLYGIQAATGEVVWRKFVGVETETPPQWVDETGKSDLIAVDARNQHLMRLSPTDGSEVWRVDIGEAFASPSVSAEGLIVTTGSGKVMQIDMESGEASQAARIPKRASVSGIFIPGTPFIYQLGDDSNLYVISSETMTCREVFYLGHDPAAVAIPPFVFSGHIVIAVNGSDYSNLHILRPTENGLKLEHAQPSIRLVGQVRTPILHYGRWGLVNSDEGDLRMLEVNKANEDEPVSVVVKTKFSNDNARKNYLTAVSGQLWIAGSGVRRYKIQKAAGEFNEQAVANGLDEFVGPSVVLGDTLFHLRRRHRSGMVSISAVDASSLKEIWRNDFSAPLAGSPVADGDNLYAISAQGDIFEVNDETLAAGSANEPLLRGSTVVQTLMFNNIVDFGGKYVATGPLSESSILTVNLQGQPPAKLADLASPADRPACPPAAFGDELLVPTRRGQVFRINPLTGQSVGAPFQPPLEPNTDTTWRAPAVLDDGNRFVIGDATGKLYLVAADGKKSLQKVHELEQSASLVSPLLALQDTVFGVTREPGGDRVIAISTGGELEVTGQADLTSGYVSGPIRLGDDRFILLLDSGETVCLDSSLQQLWSTALPPDGQDRLAGNPSLTDGKVVMAFESGKIVVVNPDTGETVESLDLGQPVSGGPVAMNGKLLVPGADGTLHVVDGLE